MSEKLDTKKVMSYFIGHRLGGQFLPQMLPGLEGGDLDPLMLGKGIQDALDGKIDPGMTPGKVEKSQDELFYMLQKRITSRSKANQAKGEKYLEENGSKPGVITTDSGLQYEVLSPGGDEVYSVDKHGEAPLAKVMYKGSLVDGTVFDQSQKPVEFNIRQVIPGFTEALSIMPVGAKWRVTIPAALAYGQNGPGKIGPNSTLIFEMELLGFTR